MSKKKFNSFETKLTEIIERAQRDKINEKYLEFDVECFNDFCGARNGKRHIALAWKSGIKYKNIKVFCDGCGEESSYTSEEFKKEKARISSEENKICKNKVPKKNMKIDYLDDDDYHEDDLELLESCA